MIFCLLCSARHRVIMGYYLAATMWHIITELLNLALTDTFKFGIEINVFALLE